MHLRLQGEGEGLYEGMTGVWRVPGGGGGGCDGDLD